MITNTQVDTQVYWEVMIAVEASLVMGDLTLASDHALDHHPTLNLCAQSSREEAKDDQGHY